MIVYRFAEESDVSEIKHLESLNIKNLGFSTTGNYIKSAQCRNLIVAEEYGIIGFCKFHVRSTDDFTTLQENCVGLSHRRQGIGRKMFEYLLSQAPSKSFRSKVLVDNLISNAFRQSLGFVCVGTVPGKRRPLNLWVYTRKDKDNE